MSLAKVGALNVSLDLETARFDKALTNAQANMGKFHLSLSKVQTAIAGAFAGSAIIDGLKKFREATMNAVDTVGALGEQAQQLGVTTKAMQEFHYAASQTGIEQSEIDKALQRLTRTLGDVQQGAKGPTKALQELGISAAQLKGLDASAALTVLADRFNALPDAAARSAVGFDLMGRSFQTLLPLLNEGSAGIQKMIADANDAGIILTEKQINQADKAADAISAIQQKSAAKTQALLATNAEALVEFEAQWADLKIGMINGLVSFNNGYHGFQVAVYNFGQSLRASFADIRNAVSHLVIDVSQWLGGRLNAVWDGVAAKIKWVAGRFKWLDDVVVRHSYVPDMVDSIGEHMARLDQLMAGKAGKVTEETADKFRELRGILDRLFPADAALLSFQDQRAKIEAGRAKFGDKSTDAALRALADERDRARLDAMPNLEIGAGAGMPDIAEVNAQLEKLGVTLPNVSSKWGDFGSAAADAFGTVTDNLKGVLLGFESLGDAIRNIIGRLAEQGLTLAFNALGASLGIPGLAGARAAGGPVTGGLPYLVGERGPEIIVPRVNGHVIPNHQLGGAASGQRPLVVHNHFPGIINAKEAREAGSQMARRIRSQLNGPMGALS